MQHNAAFHQGLHCLILLKQHSGTEILHLEISTCDPLKYKMGNPIFKISLYMGKFIYYKGLIIGKTSRIDFLYNISKMYYTMDA